MAIEGGGEVTSGTHSPMLDVGIGMGYVPVAASRAGNRADDRRARPLAHGRGRQEADLHEGSMSVAASESYPEDLLYNREHDWARIEGDEAVLGITWYAHDALGELVHYEPPAEGATIEKGKTYGEVESVKAVSDLISPLSGEVIEVNEKVVDAPETVNEDAYGEGWLDPHPHERPVRARRADGRRRLPARGRPDSELPLAHRRRSRRDAGRDRRRVGRGALPRHPGGRALRARARRAARARRGRAARGTSRSSPRRTCSTTSRSSAPGSTTTTCRPSSTRCCSAASS